MPIRVQVPGHGLVEFPDGTSQDDMRTALMKLPPSGTQAPVAAGEPDTYWAGALKGAKEGIQGGAKGFAEGMLQSPVSFAQGIASLLTTNPLTTVKDTVEAIKRLPDAVRAAGADPETWGKGVGDVTGQTMIGLAAPRVLKATAQAAGPVARSVGSAAAMPLGTAAGAYVGGVPGAVVGGTVGRIIGDAIAAVPPSTAETAATAADELKTVLSSGEAMPAAKFFEKLRQVPPDERPAILAARRAVIEAAPPEAPPAAPAPAQAAPVPAQAQTPTPAPVASPAPASPAVAAPEAAAAASVPMSDPEAFKLAQKAFADAKVAPQYAEVNNARMLIKRGTPPDEALKIVIGNRPPPPTNPAEALLKSNSGFKSEAEMNADMAARARKGQKSLMPKYVGTVIPEQPATLAQPVPAAAAEQPLSSFRISSKAAVAQEEATVVNDAVKAALQNGYMGDLDELHASLTQKMQDFKELQAETNQTHPNQILKAVAKGGGISETNESALKGEIAALKQDRDLAPSTSRKNMKAPPTVASTMQGVPGVFKESGLSMDQMLEYVKEDGRWPQIKTIQDLTDAIRDAARTPPPSPIGHVDTFKSYTDNAIRMKQFGLLLAAGGAGAAALQKQAP